MNLPDSVAAQRRQIDRTLDQLLPPRDDASRTVAAAMRHAVLGSGKRLRPILVLAAHEACGGTADRLIEAACAVELLHTYSLIHDDLPAMDDDALRRGRPTVHCVFGEAAAILAGDALLTLSFEILGRSPSGDGFAAHRAEAVVALARGSGIEGMVGGQMADLEAERRQIDRGTLAWIHDHKTAALISACCEIGAIHAGASRRERTALAAYGRSLGLAFQIADDLLDRTGSPEALGKTPGKDERSGKATYPALHGVERSRTVANDLARDATATLRAAGLRSTTLDALAQYAVRRTA